MTNDWSPPTMSEMPVFGAGIWHFATYKDRYATEGYGPPVGLLEQIDKAGAVGDLSVVDLNWPFADFDGSLDDVKAALERNQLRAIAITPEIYNRDYVKGSITNPDPAVRAQALKLLNEATELAKELGCDYVKLWFGQDGWTIPSRSITTTSGSWPSMACGSWSGLTLRSSL